MTYLMIVRDKYKYDDSKLEMKYYNIVAMNIKLNSKLLLFPTQGVRPRLFSSYLFAVYLFGEFI